MGGAGGYIGSPRGGSGIVVSYLYNYEFDSHYQMKRYPITNTSKKHPFLIGLDERTQTIVADTITETRSNEN